jgi:hypothetical protein
MYKIDNPEITNEFHEAWCFAGQELSKQGQGSLNWLKAELNPPFVDHFSFRLGNQIFSILIDVIDSKGNNSIDDFEKQRQIKFCTKNNITPAVFTIVRNLTGKLDKASSDWNLIDTRTGEAFNPVEMISDAEIPVSEWELHDFGVQVVRNFLTSAGKKIFSFQSMLDLNPTIWFSEGEKRYFVIVRTAAYPALEAEKTENLIEMKNELCAQHGADGGYFASVVLANTDDPFLPDGEGSLPILRGHGVFVKFKGIEQI